MSRNLEDLLIEAGVVPSKRYIDWPAAVSGIIFALLLSGGSVGATMVVIEAPTVSMKIASGLIAAAAWVGAIAAAWFVWDELRG